ncbi:retrovirus-related pol polyprotein from transposon TNT 1-94, partial [Tanacetum coccineum]
MVGGFSAGTSLEDEDTIWFWHAKGVPVDRRVGQIFVGLGFMIEDSLYQKKLYEPLTKAKPTEDRDKGRGRKQDRRQKQNRSRSKSKKRGQSKNRQDITCWNCNQKGHFQNQCSKHVTSRDKEVNMAAGDYDDALVCCVENTIDDRIMDSDASFHATYCKEELEKLKLRSGKVRLADDKTLDIAGVGYVVLKTSFGTSWTLKDVKYIPSLKKRLISLGQLDEEGYHIGFGDQQWKDYAAIDGRGNAALWHQRLGHISENGMKILASKGMILDLQKAVVGFCEPCVLRKQKKVSFVKFGNTRKLRRLELVHTDVYGPTSVASIGGSRYYVTFIDDSNRKVKCLKSDNGEEYSSQEFIEYCAKNRIRMLKTAMAQMRWDIAFGIRRATRSSEAEMSHLMRTLYMEPRLQQILSSDTSEGSENSRSFEDSGRSDEEYSKDRSSSEEREALRLHSYEDPPESPGLQLPAGKKALQSKWVFRVKEKQDGKKRYKAILVVKGFQQKQGVDYNEIFSPVVKMTTIRLVLSIVAAENLHLKQLDVKTAFLHGDLDEDIYMTQPEGFQSARKEENLVGQGFYMAEIKKLKRQLSQKFEMRDLGSAKQILDMSILRDKTKGTLRLSQEKYIGKFLEKFNIKDAEARCQPLGDYFKT